MAADSQAPAEPLILLAALSFQEGTQVQLLSLARPMPLPAPAGGGLLVRAVPMDALPITEVFRRPEETALRLSSEGLTADDSDGPLALDDLRRLRFAPSFQSDTELVIGVAPGTSVAELLAALDALQTVMFGDFRLALLAEDGGGKEQPEELQP